MNTIEIQRRIREQDEAIKSRLSRIRHIIAVISGKGGVGKSTVTVGLALTLASKGEAVGILDSDITGPSIPKMLGVMGERLRVGSPGIIPVEAYSNVKVVSTAFLLPTDDTPVIWRGPLRANAIRQLLSEVVWGSLDYLLVDLPPGTGDEALTIAQSIPRIDGAIIVTIPSELSKAVVKRAVSFCREVNLNVLGVVENMSGFICPHCGGYTDILGRGGGEELAREMNLKFLGRIPLDPRLCESMDRGKPYILEAEDNRTSKAFHRIAENLEAVIKHLDDEGRLG